MKYSLSAIFGLCISLSIYSQRGSVYCSQSKILAGQQMSQAILKSRSIESDKYDLHYHKLNLNMSNSSTYISGSVVFKAKVIAAQMDKFEFDLHSSLDIDSIRFNGILVNATDNGGLRSVNLPMSLQQQDEFEAIIHYKGLPTSVPGAAIGSGITNDVSPSWGARVTWTLSQPYSAYEWWPCKQSLRDKIDSIDVWITVDDSLKAGSNGVLSQITPLPANKARYEWKHRHPVDYYLISAAVGNYVDYSFYAYPTGAANPVLIQNYLYNKPNFINYVTPRIDLTADYLEHFSDLFGLYPFADEKYGHSAAPLSGGMEHQTMTTQGVFTSEIIAHELAHQWFGDYVTCGSWQDIALNEGWASYLEFLMLQEFEPNNANAHMNNVHDNVMSQPGGSAYCTDTININRLFSGRLTYDKGSAIFHTLRYIFQNDSLYFASLRKYLATFAHSTALGTDLKNVLENESGINLTPFFNEWYYGEGYPTFTVKWNQNAQQQVFLRISQTPSMPSVTPLFHIPVDIKIQGNGGDTTIRVNLNAAEEYISLPFSPLVQNIVVDPDNWILNRVSSVSKDIYLSDIPAENQNSIRIYPNPASDILYIDNPNPDKLDILDMNGKIISKHAKAQQVSISHLQPGIYYIQMGKNQLPFVKQ